MGEIRFIGCLIGTKDVDVEQYVNNKSIQTSWWQGHLQTLKKRILWHNPVVFCYQVPRVKRAPARVNKWLNNLSSNGFIKGRTEAHLNSSCRLLSLHLKALWDIRANLKMKSLSVGLVLTSCILWGSLSVEIRVSISLLYVHGQKCLELCD